MQHSQLGYAAGMNALQDTAPSEPIKPLDVASVKAISLDLDDTLWPVWPTIRKAETALIEWMHAHAPATAAHWSAEGVAHTIREQVKAEFLAQSHDFTFLRTQMIARALAQSGADPSLAQQGFEVFFAARQQVDLYAEVEEALAALAARYPLVAVSNGNANVLQMPIGRYFSANMPAIEAGVAKPDRRIFDLAAQRLNVPNAAVLHVGDDSLLDVVGAQQAGMQAVWLNREQQSWPHACSTPHQISHLRALCDLLGA